ncbi:hypothetical protein H483_0109670 [Dietzia sp. UCD-THP]|uniref:hypothetical protein n=1 Tax=Dietzia sp. UCD-THP TaxID=1292020 RepID=UPI0003768B0E|nr:hypothetical protein [Dietzia sp. UCD-THP]EYT62795.1 hypothetical protein H483_0109670 [Dietzia sp. UCD-THP]
MRRATGGAIFALALAGCSQIDALAPVGGAEIADLRYATNEVLLEQGVEILVAPVCEGHGATLRCVGETVGNETITATLTSQDGTTFDLEVGENLLYSGSVQAVLDRNGTVGAR